MTIVKPFFFFFFVVYIKYGQVKKGAKRTQHIARERERERWRKRERGGGTITDYNKMAPSHAFYPLEKKERERKKKKERRKAFGLSTRRRRRRGGLTQPLPAVRSVAPAGTSTKNKKYCHGRLPFFFLFFSLSMRRA